MGVRRFPESCGLRGTVKIFLNALDEREARVKPSDSTWRKKGKLPTSLLLRTIRG